MTFILVVLFLCVALAVDIIRRVWANRHGTDVGKLMILALAMVLTIELSGCGFWVEPYCRRPVHTYQASYYWGPYWYGYGYPGHHFDIYPLPERRGPYYTPSGTFGHNPYGLYPHGYNGGHR